MKGERHDKAAERPSVFVVHRPDARAALREVCAGLEEEGVPYVCEPAEAPLMAAAHDAAERSRLSVGVAVAASEACVHFSQLPVAAPVLHVTGANAEVFRMLGQDAARLVKVMPLSTPLVSKVAEENAP
ncbi:glycerol dehydratase reactivase beta/small subunit family protein [Myxococcus sp. 1LA]